VVPWPVRAVASRGCWSVDNRRTGAGGRQSTGAARLVARVTGWGWWAWLGLCVVACASFYLGNKWYESHMETALLRADADLTPQNPRLVRFAASLAKPAYAAHCALCHGADLKGNSSLGAPNLADNDWLYGSGQVSEIERTIYFGIRSGNRKSRNLAVMPAFGRAQSPTAKYKLTPLTPGEIRDVIAHLFTLENRQADPQAAARGRSIFLNKGECYDCHSPHGHGDPGIGAPNLTDNIWLDGDGSADSIFRTIEVGRQGVCPAWVDRLPAATLRALAVYIHLQSHPVVSFGLAVLP
jgi:cytochrome c oxidase cbb3-type subunit 3